MEHKSEQEHGIAELNAHGEGDLSAQPNDDGVTVAIDGLITETAASSSESVASSVGAAPSSPASSLPSEQNIEIVLDKPTLESPFHSPKPPTADGMSDATLDDSEIRENLLDEATENDTPDTSGEVLRAVEYGDRGDRNQDTSDGDIDEAPSGKFASDASASSQGVHPSSDDVPDSIDDKASLDTPKDIQATTNLSDAANHADEYHAITEDEETDVDTAAPRQPTHSVPPHMRPGFESQIARQIGMQMSKFSNRMPDALAYADVPHAPRTFQAHNSYQTYRSDGGREESARTGAQLMKLRNELEAERKKSANMRKSVEEEKEKVMEEALSTMTTELLNKQVKMLTHQAEVEAKERDLQFREARIEQLEVYLSEGQKQVYRESIGDEGGLTMAEVDREHDCRQAELQAKKYIAAMEGKLAIRLQGLQLREAAQQMREQQYKALMRSSFEAETKQSTAQEIDARVNEVADIEYNNGFGAGRVAGHADVEVEVRQQGFLEGYNACRETEVLLSKTRQGLISRDSPELDFLYDSAHPRNPFTMGTRIGEWQRKQGQGQLKSMTEKAIMKKEPVIEKKAEALVVHKKPKEPVGKLPPARPTFASELRGAQNMHNGHFVLANGSGPCSPATTPKINGVGSDNGAQAGPCGENVYEGRRILKYEEVEEDNLIDLL